MPHDYANREPNAVRRRDRAVSDESWIKEMLHTAPVGVFATVHDGRPFLHSNLFVFDELERAIYFHTARVGRTISNVESIEGGAPTCFSIFEMGRLLPADTALEFSVEYAGVTAFGTTHIIADESEARRALQLLLDKYAPHLRPGRDYRAITKGELQRTAVFRMAIESWSGKRKAAAVDFPGAFTFGERVLARSIKIGESESATETAREIR